jgi:hypothetical protein
MKRHLMGICLSALALSACPDAVDKAAKQRIFSPEEPPKEQLAASQPIDVEKAADDAELTYHVLAMSAAEAYERIGPFKFTATASYEWTYGKSTVSLSEKRSLDQAGASEYALHTENNRDSGMDLVRLPDRTFARSRYHKFRERKRDRGQSELVREDVFGALHTVETLFNNRLALSRDKREEIGGRGAKRFGFMIAQKPLRATGPDPWKLPPLQYPSGGPDQQTRRRADFANLRAPKAVEGALWVDIETGVPLKAELTATLAAPGEESDQATLTVKVLYELKPADKLSVAAPEDFLPDQDRPNGIAATLERFELQRGDGGVSAASRPVEPEEPGEE